MAAKQNHFDINLKPGKYVVAVSGGVDSVVLLDLLSKLTKLDLIIAHFDHGMRPDSAEDCRFVQELAKEYGLPFEYAKGKLGGSASEETARKARYKFLRSVKDHHSAAAIVTAHHQDDVIETAIINLIRGTHSRGLSSLKSTEDIVRPLIGVSRRQIEDYAEEAGLKWREDPSNQDTRYLRNYVRLSVIPALNRQDPKWRERLLNKIKRSGQIDLEINSAIDRLADNKLDTKGDKIVIPKNWLIMLPNSVGMEVMKHAIKKLPAKVEINRGLLKGALLFSKTAKPGKKKLLGKHAKMVVGQREITITGGRSV